MNAHTTNSKYAVSVATIERPINRYAASVVTHTMIDGAFEIALIKDGRIVNIITRFSVESAQAQTRKWQRRYIHEGFVTHVRPSALAVWRGTFPNG